MTSSAARGPARALSIAEVSTFDAPTQAQRRRFVASLERISRDAGGIATPWPGLYCFRSTGITLPDPTVYTPSLCIVGQGAKQATIGDRVLRYDPFQYLVIAAPMPVCAMVVEASEAKPYLSLRIDVDTSIVHELLIEMEEATGGESADSDEASPLQVSPLDGRFLDAVLRFLDAVGDPMDRKILAPAALREILYLALQGDQGDLLRRAARRDGWRPGVDRALHYIRQHLADRLDVPTIAREAGMSVSSLHHSFKSATALTPVQYLKRMRLHRARQLMVDEGCLAAEAAFRVGYESPSQFSREFKRLFGQPPRRYTEGL